MELTLTLIGRTVTTSAYPRFNEEGKIVEIETTEDGELRYTVLYKDGCEVDGWHGKDVTMKLPARI